MRFSVFVEDVVIRSSVLLASEEENEVSSSEEGFEEELGSREES
jgi:hypothetical protein